MLFTLFLLRNQPHNFPKRVETNARHSNYSGALLKVAGVGGCGEISPLSGDPMAKCSHLCVDKSLVYLGTLTPRSVRTHTQTHTIAKGSKREVPV